LQTQYFELSELISMQISTTSQLVGQISR